MPTRHQESISVVLPAYAEAPCIERVVRQVRGVLTGGFREFEILVVDDGSPDDTAAIVQRLAAELPEVRLLRHATNRGYGRALRTGFAAARMDLVFFTDADGQFDLRELDDAVLRLADADVVLGYRRRPRYTAARRFLSRGYNALVRGLFGVAVRDVDCSFKLFRRPVVEAMQLVADDFFIDTEIVAEVGRLGVRCVEVPVEHLPRLAGTTTVRASHIPRTLWTVARMWLRRRRAAPAAVAGPQRR